MATTITDSDKCWFCTLQKIAYTGVTLCESCLYNFTRFEDYRLEWKDSLTKKYIGMYLNSGYSDIMSPLEFVLKITNSKYLDWAKQANTP